MTRPRSTQVSLANTPYYHCVAHCVRRAYLCGIDHLTGENYEHRREWPVTKMKSLASIFSINICAYAVMSNHYHAILHVDSDQAAAWPQSEVIEHWNKLFSLPVLVQRYLRGQTSTVDLNPIRAAVADSPEDSDFTSIQERLRQFAASQKAKDATPAEPDTTQPADLLPLIGGEHADAPRGIVFTLPDYLQLLDWTGRAVRDDKRGAIPAHIQPIFQRMGLNHEEWLEIVQNFGRRYRLAAGAVDRLQRFGQQLVRYWLHGIGASRKRYCQPVTARA